MASELTPQPGTYALVLNAHASGPLQVGKLGVLDLRPGRYIYIGSAFGPGGLRARVARHAVRHKRLHWHIDYVRRVTELAAVWYTYDTIRREHLWAETLVALAQTSVPLPGFGASDCSCTSHFVRVETSPIFAAFQKEVFARQTEHESIRRRNYS